MCITLTFSRAQLLPAVAGGAAGHERGGAAAALPCPRLRSGRLRGPRGPLPRRRRRGRRRRRHWRRRLPGPASGREAGGGCWSAHVTAAAAAAMQAPCPEPRHFVALVTGYAWRALTMYLAVLPLRESMPVTCVCFARSAAASTGYSIVEDSAYCDSLVTKLQAKTPVFTVIRIHHPEKKCHIHIFQRNSVLQCLILQMTDSAKVAMT